MKTVWSEMIAAAPEDANGERISIMQSNPITSGGQVTPTDLDTIGVGVTGSDPNIFETGDQNETTLSQLYGDVPLSHLANAVRLVNNYQVTWKTADNPFGYALNSQHRVEYDHMAWYHATMGTEDSWNKVTLDSLMMRDAGNATDKALLDAQWHDAYGRFGPNGTDADEWGQIPNYPAP
jgi:hypothetical protein